MSTDVHQDFLMDLVDVVSNCFGEYHFVLDCVHSKQVFKALRKCDVCRKKDPLPLSTVHRDTGFQC